MLNTASTIGGNHRDGHRRAGSIAQLQIKTQVGAVFVNAVAQDVLPPPRVVRPPTLGRLHQTRVVDFLRMIAPAKYK